MFSSPHIQTIWGPKFRRRPFVKRYVEQFTFSDGDHCWLFWSGPDPQSVGSLVVLLHGLAGCSDSQYILGLQNRLTQLGHASVAVNSRGAGGRHNNRAKTYHSGETADLTEVFSSLHQRWPHLSLFAVGYSLGGSRLLNYLSSGYKSDILAAVAVCVPLDLAVCESRVNTGLSKMYRNHLLSKLIGDLSDKISHLESVAKPEAEIIKSLGDFRSIVSFRDYDNRVICPLFGFKNADDYYLQCSTRPKLKSISNQTLLIQAQDDPFMTPSVIPQKQELSEHIQLEVRNGGHVGFVDGLPLNPQYWLEHRIPEFLKTFGQ